MAVNMEYGVGMSQDEFMMKDECIVVNYNDEVIGSDNKYNVHKFIPGQPKGVLHRAFSVMLFDGEGRLLLQQRAASKITFPKVWTNTACSHPLHGQTPKEVDEPYVAGGAEPIGVKRAAVRKLRHELGTKPDALTPEQFKYMGRVHYWSADAVTWGENAPWGEHEIDYLLLAQCAERRARRIPARPAQPLGRHRPAASAAHAASIRPARRATPVARTMRGAASGPTALFLVVAAAPCASPSPRRAAPARAQAAEGGGARAGSQS